jgi:nucleoside-diphosphate-sugar epimerase
MIYNSNMEKVLVTGGAGFIGSHLCEYLLNKGYKVVCLDNLVTGSKRNIEPLLGNPNFEFIEADVCKLPDHISNQQISHIFDLASPASPIDFEKLSEEILTVNSIGVLKLLELAKNTKAKFLMASTSEVYGDPKENPQKETYWGNVNSFGRRSCYDEGKRFSEAACHVFLNKYDVDLRIVRIFNTYGPRMRTDDGRALITFVMEAIKNEPFTVFGDGTQTRSFCYVSDLVEGLYKAMFTEGTKGEVFNLGNPEEYSMNDLVAKIKEMTGTSSEIVYKDLAADDPKQRRPDINKAERYLNWKPQVGVTEGLQKTIEYYKNS